MNEQELKDETESILYDVWKDTLNITNGTAQVIILAKAYADAQITATLEVWTAANEVWKSQMAAKDAEIERLRKGATQ